MNTSYILYTGNSENHEYTLYTSNLSKALKEVRKILSIPSNKRITKQPDKIGYPKSARHYQYKDSWCKRGVYRKFFIMKSEII